MNQKKFLSAVQKTIGEHDASNALDYQYLVATDSRGLSHQVRLCKRDVLYVVNWGALNRWGERWQVVAVEVSGERTKGTGWRLRSALKNLNSHVDR